MLDSTKPSGFIAIRVSIATRRDDVSRTVIVKLRKPERRSRWRDGQRRVVHGRTNFASQVAFTQRVAQPGDRHRHNRDNRDSDQVTDTDATTSPQTQLSIRRSTNGCLNPRVLKTVPCLQVTIRRGLGLVERYMANPATSKTRQTGPASRIIPSRRTSGITVRVHKRATNKGTQPIPGSQRLRVTIRRATK